ncbi:MAG TPA: pyridoxal-phosphate dependent enzyme, partial [Acidimicrobiales bacterium]|nr:pyridoxal-phosphate dependent enzyme [Acidimicrobiales bacterium]
ATAIRIGNPASWQAAVDAAAASEGSIRAVSDDEILAAWRLLAREESVFCEPASAAGVAGLLRDGAAPGSVVVCVLTGNGLKDPDAATSHAGRPLAVEGTEAALLAAILGPR